MAKQKTEAQIDRYNRYGAPLQWLGAAIVGTVSASSTFINLVRSKFHDDNEFRQGFSVLHQAKNSELEHLNDQQIEETLKILNKYVGDHPSYKNFVNARLMLNEHIRENNLSSNASHVKKAEGVVTEVLYGAVEKKTSVAEGTLHLFKSYAEANETFMRDCKEGIERGMQSPEYKKLAIRGSKRASDVKVRFDQLYDSFAETMYGIRSKGVIGHTQGVWERFVGFGNYTKRNMIFKTAVAAGVGFGGTIMAFNQLNTRDKLNEIDKQSERADRKVDAIMTKLGVDESEVRTRSEHRLHERQREKLADQELRGKGHAAKLMESRAEAEASQDLAI